MILERLFYLLAPLFWLFDRDMQWFLEDCLEYLSKENEMENQVDGQYAIVELMGHKVVAGLVSKSEMLGKPMLRVDVPATSVYPEFTQFYGESAIYCVTFVSREVAQLTAEQSKVNPVSVYVPDLITKQQHEKIVGQYKAAIDQISRGLPEPERVRNYDPSEGDDLSDDEE